jgi:hypothetical protein
MNHPRHSTTALGCIAVLAGLLIAPWYANEGVKMWIVGSPPFTVDAQPPPACDADELEEEGLSLAECRQMADALHTVSLSSAGWFPPYHGFVSVAGTLAALLSVAVGIALIETRAWGAHGALLAFGVLCAIDVLAFVGVVNTGPLIRQAYLPVLLLVTAAHLGMTIAALAAHASQRASSPGA